MEGRLKIRYEVILATEHFDGKYHTGTADQSYGIGVPLEIVSDGTSLIWKQLRSDGKLDPRLPLTGYCTPNGADLNLLHGTSSHPIAVLERMQALALPELAVSAAGTIKHKAGSVAIIERSGNKAASSVSARLKGKWTVLENSFKYSTFEALQSGWQFKTSTANGIALGPGIAFGTLVLTDPFETDVTYTLIGGGAGIDPGKYIKTASKVILKIIAAYQVASKASSSSADADMWSTGLVFKNPLWAAGASRMMRAGDFRGIAVWTELSVVLRGYGMGTGGSIQLFFAGATPDGGFTAVIPMAGALSGISLGVGAFACGMS